MSQGTAFQGLQFEPLKLPEETGSLRSQVRQWVEAEMTEPYLKDSLRNSDFNTGESPLFSQRLGHDLAESLRWR